MEGSAVAGQDLVAARAERARACLLLADRFTTDPEQEDLSILFQASVKRRGPWCCHLPHARGDLQYSPGPSRLGRTIWGMDAHGMLFSMLYACLVPLACLAFMGSTRAACLLCVMHNHDGRPPHPPPGRTPALQVWAMKSYTKAVPLYVQTVRQSTVEQIAPFLDPGQDVVVSMEQTRLRWVVVVVVRGRLA
jgi:hypothetical protein